MTTVTPSVRPITAPQARPAAAPAGSGPGLPPIDPVKLLQRHWLVFTLAGVGGILFGIAAHFAWMAVYPFYKAQAIFQCEPAPEAGNIVSGEKVDTDEIQHFMATQAAIMTSQRVLERATQNPQIQTVAKGWCRKYTRGGVFAYQEAATDLADSLSARIIPDTYLISMSMMWKNREEVAGLVGVVRQAYLDDLRSSGNADSLDIKQSYNRTISEMEKQISDLQSKRDKMLGDLGADSLDVKEATARAELNALNEQLLSVSINFRAAQVQLAQLTQSLNQGGFIVYPEDFKQQVEMDPSIQRIRATIDSLNGSLLGLQEQGIGTSHRTYKLMLSQIAAQQQLLADTREKLLRERFNAAVEALQKGMVQLQAQGTDLQNQANQARERLNTLTRLAANVTDVTNQIYKATADRAYFESKSKLEDARRKTATADRVRTVQSEQVPQFVSFPRLIFMIPIGFFLVTGLVGGLVVLRELLDQRVKSPGDIALIPRTRVLGMVPHGSEDPSGPESVETSFIDQPRGVVAESFRQLRATINERMAQGRHKSLLVVSGMPGSGGSTVVANLAAAAAAGDQRVLVIDANFRRPAQHKIFKLGETPGLAEVLAGSHSLDQAVQASAVENLSVLTCGSPTARHYERLATDKMSAVIREAAGRYDLVLIDVAPAIVSGDANALASRCDASMLVVRALSEKRGMVNRLKNNLQDARAELLGVLVNGVRAATGGYLRRNIRATHEYQNNGQA